MRVLQKEVVNVSLNLKQGDCRFIGQQLVNFVGNSTIPVRTIIQQKRI
jgi:hypothetical protein